jgi:hypothetical protein
MNRRREKFKAFREYPLKGGVFEKGLDPRNAWIDETYRNMVYFVLRRGDEALNINQITEKLRDIRYQWRDFAPPLPNNASWELPKGNPTRKTVSKHLKELLDHAWVVTIGGLYIPTRKYIDKNTAHLNQAVRQLISSQDPEKWNFTYAGPVAGCYVFSDPPGSHRRIQDILHFQQKKFRDSLFWLDDVLRYAISIGALSTDVYSKHELDVRVLKKGWEQCFSSTKLVILAFAFSPQEFLEFLITPPGKSLAEIRLDKNWEEIKSQGERDYALYENWRVTYSERGKD